MTKRDAKFIFRIIVLFMSALAFGIGARIVLESDELTKVVQRTMQREVLIVFAPMVSLTLLQYTLAIKSFGMRSLTTEACVFGFVAAAFSMVMAPYFFGETVTLPPEDCSWWKMLGCDGITRHQDNHVIAVASAILGMIFIFIAFRREGIFSRMTEEK